MSAQTLCDVRCHVERVFGEKVFSDQKILEAIHEAGGRVTHRPESDTMDYCLVNLDKVEKIFIREKIILKSNPLCPP